MPSARIITMWTGRSHVEVYLDGVGDDDACDRLDRVLDRLIAASAGSVRVDLARVRGEDTAILEVLAATCHRLWARRGRLLVTGLGERLISRPEVNAFPEVFGPLPHRQR